MTLAHDVAERAARESYGKLLAYLAARCGDVYAAEDALADAFAAALTTWPADGVPHSPEAWLLVAARRRFLDRVRRDQRGERLVERLADAVRDAEQALDRAGALEDERLALMFACAHPAIAAPMRAPLMLQAVLGLDAGRIASAFLVAPATMSQRLVRAKQKIAATHIELAVPLVDELAGRLDAVLDAVYAAFIAGWDDPTGSDARTNDLHIEAIWLGRYLGQACPREPEVMGLLALMLHAYARHDARRDVNGAYVPLDEQDVTQWDAHAIDEAETLLRHALSRGRAGRFQIEAAIQSAHAARRHAANTDWAAIVSLYDTLLALTGSPVVALNRAVAVGRATDARAGLEALELVASDSRLDGYQPYWAARADLAARNGDVAQARRAYARAIGLTIDPAVRRYLIERAER